MIKMHRCMEKTLYRKLVFVRHGVAPFVLTPPTDY